MSARTRPEAAAKVLIATKGGHTRGPNATWWIDGTPEYLARAARDAQGWAPKQRERAVSPALRIFGMLAQSADKGAARKGFGPNTLGPFVGDANVETPEFKAYLVNIEKAAGGPPA